jgi:hypothetical protein
MACEFGRSGTPMNFIQQMSLQDESWSDWAPERFYDNRIVQKLKQEGFLDAVYQQFR